MKKTIYLLIPAALIITACGSGNKQSNASEKSTDEMHVEASEQAHDHSTHMHSSQESEERTTEATLEKSALTADLIDSYLQIKNALVNDDSKAAANSSKSMIQEFADFEMIKLTDAQHKEFMEIAENSKENLEHIVKSPIDHQREHFEVLSNDLNDLITLIGTDKTLYQVFCPMYNDGQGAIWISEIKEIKNPYYGNKMLTCGEIQKEI